MFPFSFQMNCHLYFLQVCPDRLRLDLFPHDGNSNYVYHLYGKGHIRHHGAKRPGRLHTRQHLGSQLIHYQVGSHIYLLLVINDEMMDRTMT